MATTIVALYDEIKDARAVVKDLKSADFSNSKIELVSSEAASENSRKPTDGKGLINDLTGRGVPNDEAGFYAEGVRRGGSLVMVEADSSSTDKALDIMDGRPAVDYEDRTSKWRQEGWSGYEDGKPAYSSDESAQERDKYSVPVVEEDIQVGKREVERGRVRVHTSVEEVPVEERVQLHDEEVHVERRDVDRKLSASEADAAFKEGTVEVTEHGEEAVVSKEAHVTGEVVVDKESKDREQVVSDTVRKTRVDVDDTTKRG